MKTTIFIFLLTINLSLLGNDINGKVFGLDPDGTKSPLPKATIQWLNTKSGVIADKSGSFKIEKSSISNKLIVSYVGYKTDTLTIEPDATELEIVLQSGFQADEVKIIGKQESSTILLSEPQKTELISIRGLQKAACCNLAESFMTNPSVDVNYTDAITGARQIKLLGLEGGYTQLMTERIPNLRGISAPFGLNFIPGTWMESISISKGAASVVDGYESITGQINVEYKKPEEMMPALVNAYVDNSGRFEGNFDASMQVGDQLFTSVFGHASLMNTEVDRNFDTFIDKPLTNQINLMNKWRYIGDTWENITAVRALYEDRKGGQIGFFPSKNNAFYGTNIETKRVEFFTKNGFKYSDDGTSSIGTMFSAIYHDQDAYFGKNNYTGKQLTIFGNAMLQSSLDTPEDGSAPLHNYTIGASIIHDKYDESFKDTLINPSEVTPGVYLEYKFTPAENFSLISGIRFDFHNIYGRFITPRFHLRYAPEETLIFRASAGKGYHIARIFAENTALMSSSRQFVIEESLRPEEAWNYGINFSYDFELFEKLFTLNADFYHTDFINQVIVDTDQNPRQVHFYNLRGDSYSNSFQIDLKFEPVHNFELTLAYRMNDVWMDINGKFMEKPLISKHKAFANLAYSTMYDEWKFDLTTELNGKGRLPNTSGNPDKYKLNEFYPAFLIMHAQVSKKFGNLEFYVGGENLLDFKQEQPILAYDDPYSIYFDSSIVWGPIMGRMIYAGFRIDI